MPTDFEEQAVKYAIKEFKKEDKEYGQAFEKLYNTEKAFKKIGFVLNTQEEIKDALDKTKKYRVAMLAFMNLTKKKQKTNKRKGLNTVILSRRL